MNNLRQAEDTTLMAENEEELKSLLMKVREDSEKVGLKLNIQKTKIMASVPITSWEIDGETVKTVTDFIYRKGKESEVTQWCPTLCDPMDCSPIRLLCPWDFPGKNTGVGCHFLPQEIFLTQGLTRVSHTVGRHFTV